jgi:hypothetical protein
MFSYALNLLRFESPARTGSDLAASRALEIVR